MGQTNSDALEAQLLINQVDPKMSIIIDIIGDKIEANANVCIH